MIKSAEQLSSEDDEDSDKDVDDHDSDSAIDDDDATNIDEDITKKQMLQSAVEEQELGEPENPKEQETDKKKIRQ